VPDGLPDSSAAVRHGSRKTGSRPGKNRPGKNRRRQAGKKPCAGLARYLLYLSIMEHPLTSITGIVIPASWDTSGAILGTAIVTFDEDTVMVADTGSGRTLIQHLRKTVTVTGQMSTRDASKTIHVLEFRLHGSGEAA
jgi:hypothetical protein